MSTQPKQEHVEAVMGGLGWRGPRGDAEALLTHLDPAVLDAFTDALVRAGRLREETAPKAVWGPCDDPEHTRGGLVLHSTDRRHVVGWELDVRLVSEWGVQE